MRMYLDTSSSTMILELDDKHYEWESGRALSKEIFTFIHEKLQEQGKDWQDLTEIHFFAGPGSFTGLRIGATVVNTLADQLNIPLYDQNGVQKPLIMPEYGRPANISKPKK